ncbi:MAG: sig20 [Nonomuraea muscovyensis]|nr:sig20 [Nonomuraea muscovyensis]
MYARPTYEVETVLAARAGDRRAVDELVTAYLPLVYNIAGRAMNGHPDVDDVVQETMSRVVTGVSGLRDPESFRSWVVAIAMNQVREWRRAGADTLAALDEAHGLADASADFAALTVTRLGLSGQRRETAEAARWLDADDREALSLWWLEVAGRLGRAELAAGLGLPESHAAVRVRRVRQRLETARAVVRALAARPRCAELHGPAASWDGRPSPLWRKRLSRHVRECPACSGHAADLVPAERLLAGLGLVAVPAGLTAGLSAGLMEAAAVPVVQGGLQAQGGLLTQGGLLAKGKAAAGAAGSSLAAKPLLVAAVSTSLVAGGAVAVRTFEAEPPPPRAAPAATVSAAPARTPSPIRPSETAPTTQEPVPARTGRPAGVYGVTVDTADQAPPPGRRPGPLPRRPVGTLAITGVHGHSRYGGAPSITHRGDHTTISGRGYVEVRWGILYRNRIGAFAPATWTGLKGRLFHVASGGGRRLDDESAPGVTWMGSPDTGFVRLPPGHQQMWQNEFYYLDGQVTLHNNERGADLDLTVAPRTWTEVWRDISTRPDPRKGVLRYGLTRDTGDDRAPVPQYVTRATPADPARVPQHSRVRATVPATTTTAAAPAGPGAALRTGVSRVLRPVNREGTAVTVSGGVGALGTRALTLRVVPGLAGSGGYSFVTSDGRHLRHRDFVIRFEADDGSALFERDATFRARPGAATGSVRLESVNYPGRFVRHRAGRLYLDDAKGQDLAVFRSDSSFRVL